MLNTSLTTIVFCSICIFGNVAITFETCPVLCALANKKKTLLSKSDVAEQQPQIEHLRDIFDHSWSLAPRLSDTRESKFDPKNGPSFDHIWSLSCSSLASIRLSLALLSSSTASALSFSQCLQYWLFSRKFFSYMMFTWIVWHRLTPPFLLFQPQPD